MSRAEKFIQDCTRNCSNELDAEYVEDAVYIPWLTPDQALRAVEIAKEEMIEKACKWLNKNTGFFNDREFIKAMKNER